MKKSIGRKTVSYPLPVYIVGTYDEHNIPNIMAASWGGICCSEPPCIAVSIRKSRYTYNNLLHNMAFSVNIPSCKYVKEADYTGIHSGKNENKFESLNLTAVKAENVNAPYVKEFPLALICKVIKIVEIGVHDQFIGEILDVLVDEDVLDTKGNPILEKVDAFSYNYFMKSYHKIGEKISDAYLSKQR